MKMKKLLVVLIVIMSLAISSISTAAEPINVYIDNLKLEMEVQPIILDGRTLVPLRAIFEALGASVQWDQKTKTVVGELEDKKVSLQIDNKVAKINGKDVALDVPAVIVEGRTLVPVRFIAESLGAEVTWDGVSKSVMVSSKGRETSTYKVTRVVDGDTMVVLQDGQEKTVRLIGVDTPELSYGDLGTANPEGEMAARYTESTLKDKSVTLELDVQETDVYGRVLAYVWLDGVLFNRLIVEQGVGRVATYPPNVKYVDEFTAAQENAIKAKVGIWGLEAEDVSKSTPESGMFIIDRSKQIVGPVGNPETCQFIGSLKSDKYHKPGYTHTGQILDHNLIYFESVEHARLNGYVPCGICFR